jgi:uncharacterized protein YuzE
MKISYDSEIDALYIRLVEGKHECRNFQLNDEITLNLGDNDLLVGIEILDAKDVLGTGNVPQVILDNIPFQVA